MPRSAFRHITVVIGGVSVFSLQAANYHVATNGNDGTKGEQSSPLKTIAAAVAKATAGSGATTLKGGSQSNNEFSAATSNFASVDPSSATAPRKDDGRLPDISFMHLTEGSDLIDAGGAIDNVPFNGSKPDLGCFESG